MLVRFVSSARLALIACLLCTAILCAPSSAAAAPGDLDPTFAGGAGTERLFPSKEDIVLSAVAVQADGKIVAVGTNFVDPAAQAVFAVRLLANGEFDPGFGAGGIATTPFAGAGNFGTLRAVAIQPDGKIVAAGAAKGAVKSDYLVMRWEPNGAPDPSFGGGDGIELVQVLPGDERAEAIALGAGGRILLTGEGRVEIGKEAFKPVASVAVLKADGKPDPSFSADGVTSIEAPESGNNDEGEAILEQPDGKILVADSTGAGAGNGFTVARLLPGGLPDPAFDGDGFAITPIPPAKKGSGAGGRVSDIGLLPDGRILAAGYGFEDRGTPPKTDSNFAALRLTSEGKLDPSFGGAGTGVFTRDVGLGEDSAQALLLTPSGQIVLAGSYDASPSASSPALMRLTPEGAIDPGFGVGGIVTRGLTAPFGETFEGAAMDSEGRTVLVSRAYVGGGDTEVAVTRFLGDRQPAGVAGPVVGPPAPNRPPKTRIKAVGRRVEADALKGFSGTASDPEGLGLRKVQIALQRKVPTAKGEPKACAFLKPRGGFKTATLRKGKACPQRWLDAKGTAKWTFRLMSELAPGRYVVFARATDAAGVTEAAFSRKAGNRLGFRVLEPEG